MTRQIRLVASAFLILFGLLFVNVNYLQVFAAEELANHPANKRLLIQEYEVDRGEILAADRRTVLARSRETGGSLRYLRRYPEGDLYAHLTGYHSFIFGRSEVEQSYNRYLSGRADELFPERLIDDILGRDRRGASVVLTVDAELQELASDALEGRPGAVAAIDPRTGAVLAMVANPSYNPNQLSSHDGESVREAWDELNDDPGRPMVSRANRELFPPGSTFKVVTAAAALESGADPDTSYPNPRVLDLPDTDHTLANFGGGHCLGGASQVTLAQALEISCNVTFGHIGLELGAEELIEQARRFGFGEDIPMDIPFAEGQIEDAGFFRENRPRMAISAIGQGDVRTNVLHMALVAGAIGNDGVMMEPRVAREIRDPTGRVIRTIEPQEYGQPLRPANARALSRMMQAVVDGGTGTAAQIQGTPVAGKTGTAQVEAGRDPHAWFIAFAPVEQPRIAVAVVLLGEGDLGSEATGGALAAPIARTIIDTALSG